MMKLLDGSFEYKGYIAEVHEFEGKYYGKINFDGVYQNFEKDNDTEALDEIKKIIDAKA